jgi:murein L,D-transpeptidase YafK
VRVTAERGRRVAALALGAALAGVLPGCALLGLSPLDRFRPVSVSVPPPPTRDDDDHLAWAESEPWVVVVRKSCRTLDVYRWGERVRSYPAVFGASNPGRKLYEGDRRTPTGLYSIVDKRPHPRWRHFLLLDYPNLGDLHRHREAIESDDVPRRGHGHVGAGSAIGIHGTDKPSLNGRSYDWTLGCVSIGNAEIDELASIVPLGTLVLIEE